MRYGWFAGLIIVLVLSACASDSADDGNEIPTLIATEVAIAAEAETCPAEVTQALGEIDAICAGTGRNQVCYGNVLLEAIPREELVLDFDSPGDIITIDVVQRLILSSDIEANAWGVALLRLQANLPDTLPGQNLTFLLFGNTEFESADERGDEALQSYYFRAGVSDSPCEEIPDSGVLVQTPDGVETVSFRINEVDITLGSTAYLQAEPGGQMAVNVIEGQAEVTSQGVTERVRAGTRTRIDLDDAGIAVSPPTVPERYEADRLVRLPVNVLQRRIAISDIVISENFPEDDAEWSIENAEINLTHRAADAMSDGSICGADEAAEDFAWYFDAPADWLGDQSDAFGGVLTAVIQHEDSETDEVSGVFLMASGDKILIYDENSMSRADWRTYNAPLRGGPGWLDVTTGEAVTDDVMLDVLRNLEQLRIRGDFGAGDAITCLDYVQLTRSIAPRTPTPPTVRTQRFVGIVDAAPVGFEVEGEITAPGQQNIYEFTAEPNQAIYLETLPPRSMDLQWMLTDEDGTALFRNQRLRWDQDVLVLERGGNYTLTVEGVRELTGEYAFKVWDVRAQSEREIAIGDEVSGEIESIGVTNIYHFIAEAGQQIYLETLPPRNIDMQWTLANEEDEILFRNERLRWDQGVLTLERGGRYSLSITGRNTTTGDYGFIISNVQPIEEFEAAIGDEVSGEIANIGSTNIYYFEASRGQQIYLETLPPRNIELYWSLADEDDVFVFRNQRLRWHQGVLTLERVGRYALTITGRNNATGDYAIKIWDVREPDEVEINLDDEVSGEIQRVGATNIYYFTVEAGQQIYLETLPPRNIEMRWMLLDEDGEAIFRNERLRWDQGVLTLERGGRYSLAISGHEAATGEYGFVIWDVHEPDEVAINIGDEVSGEIQRVGATNIYHFTVEAGQQIYLETLPPRNIEMRWTLLDEDGEAIFRNERMRWDQGVLTLERGGRYFLSVSGYQATTGEYSFLLREARPEDQ